MASIARSALLRQTATASRALAAPSRGVPTLLEKAIARPAATKTILDSVRASTFHTTSRRNILPPGPQHIEGTVNDPAPVPPTSPSHGSYHWTFERLIALGLVPLTVAPFAAGSLNPVLDAVLASSLLIHSHMGLQAIIIDYIPKKRFPVVRKVFWWGLNAATAVVGLALYEFETTDVGLTEAIKRVWKA